MPDWGAGRYEETAARLEPAAAAVVAALEVRDGLRVLDVACGTGNAALLAAEAGARATGVDLAPRLLTVARGRADDAGREVPFVPGDATALPFGDDVFDAAVSVFGVIFAPAEAAAAELLRVVGPGGSVVLATWQDAGPFAELSHRLAALLGRPPTPLPWSGPQELRALFAGRDVAVEALEVRMAAPTVEAYVEEVVTTNPVFLEVGPALAATGADLRAEALAVFGAADERPAEGFAFVAPAWLVTVRPPRAAG